jgi:hypothetical protein
MNQKLSKVSYPLYDLHIRCNRHFLQIFVYLFSSDLFNLINFDQRKEIVST